MKTNFKRVISSILTAVIILSVSPVAALSDADLSSLFSVKATALTSGDYAYELRDSYATITGYKGSAVNLFIPSELDGYTVTSIDQGAFAENSVLEYVMLPDTITNIGASNTAFTGSFENCIKLKTITFRSGKFDAVIGAETFMNCKSLQSVIIPGNYSLIKEDAFRGCTALESVILRKSDYAFANQAIESEAFRDCSSLTSIILPTTLNSIASYAFYGCAASEIKIPEGVTSIGYGAFAESPNLTTITLPSTLTTIGAVNSIFTGAFENCPKLQKVTFRAGTADAAIGAKTFMNCRSLQSIIIPGNYATIREDAFRGCTALKSFTLKKSAYGYPNQSIEHEAFRDCSALKTISLPTTLKSISPHAFHGCAATELKIPEGVVSIGYGAFANSPYLTKVTLPGTLTTIGAANTAFTGAFENCSKLKKVIFNEGNQKLTIGAETFMNCSSLSTVHLPLNLTEIKQNAFYASTANLTLCCESEDSYIKEYADSNAIAFELCDGTHEATPPQTAGDVNNDKNINATDALLVLQHTVGKKLLTGNALIAADVTKDDAVNATDALSILRYSVGKTDKL